MPHYRPSSTITAVGRQLRPLVLLLLLVQPVFAAQPARLEGAFQLWGELLQRYVDGQGRTDFYALAKQPEDLRQLVDFVEQTSPASEPELFPSQADVLAYHINAYNILAMYGVIDQGVPENFDNFFKRTRFFKLRSVLIGGEKMSLHTYENEVIRPIGEPRIHFVLNCMVRDCPRLPQQAFLPSTLEQQLEAATQEFFSKDKHIRIDTEKGTLYLSAILDFYTKDFVASGKSADLLPYVNRYRQPPVPSSFRVKFIDYDWTVNQQPD